MAVGEAISGEVECTSQGIEVTLEGGESEKEMATPDVNNTAMQLERAEQVYKGYNEVVGMPSKGEVWVWCLYELCSYFIYNTVVPVLFPLIISQIKEWVTPPDEGYWVKNDRGLMCRSRQFDLYKALINESIPFGNRRLSPLEWTSFCWGLGLILAAPILGSISTHLDNGSNQMIIAGSAIGIGALFCLPSGFITANWIFPPYIAAIVAANTVAAASHTRHLGLMVRGFAGSTTRTKQFQARRGLLSWFSLYATAAGGFGSALISTFTYYMLRNREKFVSLWVVSIFSGLKWAGGIIYVIFIQPGASTTFDLSSPSPIAHLFAIFGYPHALGSLIVAFFSSFTTMCIFSSAVLYLVGGLCFKPLQILFIWLTYFLFPIASMPMIHLLQLLLKASSVKMHLLGFLLSLVTTGAGFFYRDNTWKRQTVFIFAALQSTSVGLLHAFSRVLIVGCSPKGKEGAFAVWLSWWEAVGTLLGFAVATSMPGNVSRSFGIAFCTAAVGSLVLVYGNLSDFGGAKAVGSVVTSDASDDVEKNSHEEKVDSSFEVKKHGQEETA